MALEPNSVVEVMYAYRAADPSQLSLAAGERLTVLNQDKGTGWCMGSKQSGEVGIFPRHYVRPVVDKIKFNRPKEKKEVDVSANVSKVTEVLRERERMRSDLGLGAGGRGFDSSGGPAQGSVVTEQAVARLAQQRARQKLLERVVEKLDEKMRALRDGEQSRRDQFQSCEAELHGIKTKIGHRMAVVSKSEERLKRLRRALGEDVADDDIMSLDGLSISSSLNSGIGRAAGASIPTPPPELLLNTAQQQQKHASPATRSGKKIELDESSITDRQGKKIVRKLRKRLNEADETIATYEKQRRKISKKKKKLLAAIEEMDKDGLEAAAKEKLKALKAMRGKVERARQGNLEGVTGATNDPEVAQVAARLSEVDGKLTKYAKKLAAGTALNDELQATIVQHQQAVAELESKIRGFGNEVAERQARVQAMKHTLEERERKAREEIDRLAVGVNHLRSMVAVEDQRCKLFEQQLAELKLQQGVVEDVG